MATASDAGLAAFTSRQLSDRQFFSESKALPEQQEDIPLDTGDDISLDTASVDALKGVVLSAIKALRGAAVSHNCCVKIDGFYRCYSFSRMLLSS